MLRWMSWHNKLSPPVRQALEIPVWLGHSCPSKVGNHQKPETKLFLVDRPRLYRNRWPLLGAECQSHTVSLQKILHRKIPVGTKTNSLPSSNARIPIATSLASF